MSLSFGVDEVEEARLSWTLLMRLHASSSLRRPRTLLVAARTIFLWTRGTIKKVHHLHGKLDRLQAATTSRPQATPSRRLE